MPTMEFPSFPTEAVVSFGTFGIARALVVTPFEGCAKKEILLKATTSEVIRSISFLSLWKGVQPNILKFSTRTPVQIGSVKLASSLLPPMDPTIRGGLIGLFSSGLEATVNNSWNVFVTRFVQGQGWRVIKQEGFPLLYKGLSPALAHRSLSNVIYWSSYEKFHQLNPNNSALNGIIAGTIQVCLTAPFYIATTLRQGINPPKENLFSLFRNIVNDQGFARGLFFRGLVPRLLQSWLTSAPLMMLIEKYGVVSRK